MRMEIQIPVEWFLKRLQSVFLILLPWRVGCHDIHYRTMEHSEPDKAAILYLEVAGLHDVSRLTVLLECLQYRALLLYNSSGLVYKRQFHCINEGSRNNQYYVTIEMAPSDIKLCTPSRSASHYSHLYKSHQ